MQQRKQYRASGTNYVPQENRSAHFDITVPPPLTVIENRFYGEKGRRLHRQRVACRILLPVTCLIVAACVTALIVLKSELNMQHRQYMAMTQRNMSLATTMDTLNSELALASSESMIRYEAENALNMYIPEQ